MKKNVGVLLPFFFQGMPRKIVPNESHNLKKSAVPNTQFDNLLPTLALLFIEIYLEFTKL